MTKVNTEKKVCTSYAWSATLEAFDVRLLWPFWPLNWTSRFRCSRLSSIFGIPEVEAHTRQFWFFYAFMFFELRASAEQTDGRTDGRVRRVIWPIEREHKNLQCDKMHVEIIHRWMYSIYGMAAERNVTVKAWLAHSTVVVCSRSDKYCRRAPRRRLCHRIPLKLIASRTALQASGDRDTVPCCFRTQILYCMLCYHIIRSLALLAFLLLRLRYAITFQNAYQYDDKWLFSNKMCRINKILTVEVGNFSRRNVHLRCLICLSGTSATNKGK